MASGLRPGDTSGVIELPNGCYLMRVEDFRAAHLQPLSDVRDEVEKTLLLEEQRRLQTETTPSSPSNLVEGFEPAVERVILRCLDPDPARRPASALSVAAALPGGDPIAAALAAGETPSPEMVAASGGEGSLSPRTAWSLLAGVVAVAGVVLAIAPQSSDLGLAPMSRSPVVYQKVRRGLLGVVSGQPLASRLRQPVFIDGNESGVLTSGTDVPIEDRYLGLAVVSLDRTAPGTRLSIGPQGSEAPAVAVRLPMDLNAL